jgi:riboflavin kinase/FMN adenylyltransferase
MTIKGVIIEGLKLGSKIGFPTANLKLQDDNFIPENGVYAVFVNVFDKKFKGMLNVGYRPTFNLKELSIEVHIFDFHENIYGLNIEVEIIKKIREEIKFNSKEELKNQLEKDKIESDNILKFFLSQKDKKKGQKS